MTAEHSPAGEDLRPAEIPPVMERTATLLTEHYVFPEIGERLAALLYEGLAGDRYREAGTARRLAELVTEDLQSVNGDLHLRLKYHAEPVPEGDDEALWAELERRADLSLGGVPRIERLTGGIVHLELGPSLLPVELAAEPLVAAFTLVSRAEALILDLRAVRGGDPRTVALICSYLLDEDTHLNTMHFREKDQREDRVQQFWTLPYVPGHRFGGTKPLYLLTSAKTFSGGEELAYNMQQLGRATLIGETTGGGAHPRRGFTVHPHLEATIPTGRAVNPVSGGNWEGTGVIPDVTSPAGDALGIAHQAALTAVAALDHDSPSVREARQAR
jgi:hypothetical protein